MRFGGIALMAVGLLSIVAAWGIDTSVGTVNNLGLMQSRMIIIHVGVGLFVAGAILCGCGSITEKLDRLAIGDTDAESLVDSPETQDNRVFLGLGVLTLLAIFALVGITQA